MHAILQSRKENPQGFVRSFQSLCLPTGLCRLGIWGLSVFLLAKARGLGFRVLGFGFGAKARGLGIRRCTEACSCIDFGEPRDSNIP